MDGICAKLVIKMAIEFFYTKNKEKESKQDIVLLAIAYGQEKI